MKLPLEGRRIVVTRPGPAGEELTALLRGLGADVRQESPIEIVEIDAPADLPALVGSADALLVTSARGLQRLRDEGLTLPSRAHCVGRSSAAAAREAGLELGVVAAKGGLEALVEQMLAELDLAGLKLFWPSSELSDEAPTAALLAAGVSIDRVALYEPESRVTDAMLAEFRKADVLVFASPSAMQAILDALSSVEREELIVSTEVVAIGKTTAEALRGAGWRGIHVAPRPDNEGLLAICLEHLAR